MTLSPSTNSIRTSAGRLIEPAPILETAALAVVLLRNGYRTGSAGISPDPPRQIQLSISGRDEIISSSAFW